MTDWVASMELQYVKALEARLARADEIVANLKRHVMACGVNDVAELIKQWEGGNLANTCETCGTDLLYGAICRRTYEQMGSPCTPQRKGQPA